MTRVAVVIPARRGSKRIPGKNIKPFLGVPSLTRAIAVAKQAGMFETIMVSTDDEQIAKLARSNGAETPALRPEALADDETPTRPVILHAIREWLGDSIDIVACLYPVTPLLDPQLLALGVKLASSADGYVFPAERSRHPVQRAIVLNENGRSRSREPEYFFERSQDLEATYFDAGQFYVAKREVWETVRSFHDGGLLIEVEQDSTVDVDTPEDWKRAEHLYQLRLHSMVTSEPVATPQG